MWQTFQLNHDTGNWNTLDDPKPVADEQISDNVFIFWAGSWPEEHEEQHEIAEAIIKANHGRVLRVTLGARLVNAMNPNSTTSCGRCFCVIDENGRQCEGGYQRNGHVIWVKCSGSC